MGGSVPVLVEALLAAVATHKLLEQLPHEPAAAHNSFRALALRFPNRKVLIRDS